MAKIYMKKCLISLIIREMQIKTIMRYHLIPIRIAVIKKTENTGKDKERRAPLHTIGGNVNWYSLY